MEIKLKDGEVEAYFSDERLDNENYVELTLKDIMSEDTAIGTFLLSELLSACIAFDAKRSRSLTDDK